MEPSNWQMGLSSLRERAKYAFNNSLFSDVRFQLIDKDGENVFLSAHKFILAFVSPVFESMFFGKLAEAKQPIELTDCTKEAFEQLLLFAYSDEVNLTSSQAVIDLLYLADKYMIPTLTEKCREFFKSMITPQNVFRILSQVWKLSDKSLEEACWEVIDKQTSQIVISTSFCDISIDLLSQVLCRDSLRVKEIDLFQAVERWASKSVEDQGLVNNGETKRQALGDNIIKLVRFPLMSQKEFAEIVLPTGILELQEVTELIQHFNNVTGITAKFSKKERAEQFRLLIPPNHFDGHTETVIVSKVTNCLWFTVNKSVSLQGFRVLGESGCSYDVKVILDCTKTNRQFNKTTERIEKWLTPVTFQTGEDKIDSLIDSYYGYSVPLEKPLVLSPKAKYKLYITITPGTKDDSTKFALGCNPSKVVYCEDLQVSYTVNKCYLYKDALSDYHTKAHNRGLVSSVIFQNEPMYTFHL